MTDEHFTLDERSDDGPRRTMSGAVSQQDGSKDEGPWDAGRKAAGAAADAWTGAITDAVKLADRIITEQIELGKKVAGQFNDQVYGFGDYANAPQELAESMVRSFTELSSSWLKMMVDMSSMFVGGKRSTNGSDESAGGSGVGNVEIVSRLGAQPSSDFFGVTATSDLTVSPLVSDDPDLPPLTEIAVRTYPPYVTVTVPDEQPSGSYFGAVFDRSERRVAGWIAVTVSSSPAGSGS
ncbi:MAG: hypothetical protein ACE5GX_06765 [Thermoanaerobaculia bacterium]